MKKRTQFSFLIIVLLTISNSCTMEHTEFKPVLLINDKFVIDEAEISDNSKQNIIHVLQYYRVKYKINNTKIMIEKSVWNDKDLMWNYTNKSRNNTWLISHPIE